MFGNAVNALLLVLVDDTVGHALEPVVLKMNNHESACQVLSPDFYTFPLQSPAAQPAVTRAQAM